MDTKIALLDISKDDLESCHILFNSGHYIQALFMMQQSVEKAIKYIGLENGLITEDELMHKIGHKAEKILFLQIEQVQHLTGKSSHNVQEDYIDLLQEIKSTPWHELVESVKLALEGARNESFHEKDFAQLIELIWRLQFPDLEDKIKENPELRRIVEEKKSAFFEYLPNYLKSVQIMFITNSIISHYVSNVRYPDPKTQINPLEEFTKEHGLVQLLPSFIDNMSFALNAIKPRV